MAGIPLVVGTSGSAGPPGTRLSCFVKFNTIFTHTTTLWDVQFGTVGYMRLIWTPTENFVAEASYRGSVHRIVLTAGGFVFQANHWYWVSVAIGGYLGSGSGWHQELAGQVSAVGGAVEARVNDLTDCSSCPGIPPVGYDIVSSGLGWGVPISSAYNPFPNAIGDVMTELVVETSPTTNMVFSLLGIPSNPLTPTTTPDIVALYHCDSPLGGNQVIKDATSNHYDLSAATMFNGDLIIHDSPF